MRSEFDIQQDINKYQALMNSGRAVHKAKAMIYKEKLRVLKRELVEFKLKSTR